MCLYIDTYNTACAKIFACLKNFNNFYIENEASGGKTLWELCYSKYPKNLKIIIFPRSKIYI